MRRVIGQEEEESVVRLMYETAEELGVQRPLDVSGWYQVKDYLRSTPSGKLLPGWSINEYMLVRNMACSNLVIDPTPTLAIAIKQGPSGIADLFGALLTLRSHGGNHRLHEVFQATLIGIVCCILSAIFALPVWALGWADFAFAFKISTVISLLMVSWVVNSNTIAGLIGLTAVSYSAYVFGVDVMNTFSWGRFVEAVVSLGFGVMLVYGWLR